MSRRTEAEPTTDAKRRAQPSVPVDWSGTPFIEIDLYRVACPYCGLHPQKVNRTENNGDGTATRKTICQACGKPYRVIVPIDPLPATGNWTFPDPYTSPQ